MQIHDGTARTLYAISLLIISAFTIVGYSVYALAIWNRKELQKKTIWMTSLAIADVMMVLNFIVSGSASLKQSWAFENFGCQVNALLGLGFGFANIASMTFIAIDKYYQVCKPEKFGVNYGFFLVCVWGLSFLAAALPAFGFGAYDRAKKDTVTCLVDLSHNTINRTYIVTVALIWFVYPVTKMIRYYNKLVKESKEPQMLAKVVPGIFLMCYTPYALYAGLEVTVGLGTLPVWCLAIIHLLPKCICASNPYVYMQSDPELLQACRDVVSWKKEEKKEA